MALFKANVSYKLGPSNISKSYLINATSLKAALVKVFTTNPDLDSTTEANIACESVTTEILN